MNAAKSGWIKTLKVGAVTDLNGTTFFAISASWQPTAVAGTECVDRLGPRLLQPGEEPEHRDARVVDDVVGVQVGEEDTLQPVQRRGPRRLQGGAREVGLAEPVPEPVATP